MLQVGLASRKLARIVKQLIQVFSSLCQRRREIASVVQTLKDKQNLHNFLERKAELAVRGEKLAQKRIYEAEADMEIRRLWRSEDGNRKVWKQPSVRLIENSSPNDCSYNRQSNRLIRLKERE